MFMAVIMHGNTTIHVRVHYSVTALSDYIVIVVEIKSLNQEISTLDELDFESMADLDRLRVAAVDCKYSQHNRLPLIA